MSPEQRKTASEFQLHKRGIRINLGLPAIESNEEVQLRSADVLHARLIALWAVVGVAADPDNTHFRDYIAHHKIEACLSVQEHDFLFGDARSVADCMQFSCRRESLFFLVWCAGLIDDIDVASEDSDIAPIMQWFPQGLEAPVNLQNAIQLRSKNAVLSWADFLYRVHWSVRHANLIGKSAPANLNGNLVQQWHQAVNWMIRYEDEDDWDQVGTDT